MYPQIFTHLRQNIGCPSTDITGHGQLLNGAKMDLLLALLSKIEEIFMVNSRDKTYLIFQLCFTDRMVKLIMQSWF